MTIVSLLEACEPTYRIDYRDQAQMSAWWTNWRPLAGARYLDMDHKPLPHVAHHLEGLTRRQAEVRIRVAKKAISKDIRQAGGSIRFELRATPDSVWWPYPGAPEPLPFELIDPRIKRLTTSL